MKPVLSKAGYSSAIDAFLDFGLAHPEKFIPDFAIESHKEKWTAEDAEIAEGKRKSWSPERFLCALCGANALVYLSNAQFGFNTDEQRSRRCVSGRQGTHHA